MTNILLKDWATKKGISRRKAEYLASMRPDLVVKIPVEVKRVMHAKAIDDKLEVKDFTCAK